MMEFEIYLEEVKMFSNDVDYDSTKSLRYDQDH